MLFLYNLGIHLYSVAIHIASLFKPKAHLWVNGRKDWKQHLVKKLEPFQADKKLWVHCASLGEFEQGRPLIEEIKKRYPHYRIVLSFFSPSGYELRKDYEFADVVTYLPSDTKQNVRQFIDCCKPEAVIFVKYEFWLNYLFELDRRNIPTFLVSAIFKKHQPFFKWYGGLFTKALKTYKGIMVQDEESLTLLESLSVRTGTVCGDTRIDRVLAIKERSLPLGEIKSFANDKVIVAGSTWPKDEVLLLSAFKRLRSDIPELKLIIAPHETDKTSITDLENKIKQNGLSFGLYLSGDFREKDILVINTIGILSSLYKFGTLAYIGGGFNNGIHNILEPAVYGMPVVFGPNNKKFIEAANLLHIKGAAEIHSEEDLFETLRNYLNDPQAIQKAAQACENYIASNRGASERILSHMSLL